MGLSEIGYRFQRAFQSRFERIGIGIAVLKPPAGDTGTCWIPVSSGNFDRTCYSAAADRIVSGYFNVFALRECELGFPPEWNRDPKTGDRSEYGIWQDS